MNLEAEDEQIVEDEKLKGLHQVEEEYLLQIAVKKKSNWGGIWKSIKTIDKDSNGYVTIDELEEIFREQFPMELDKRSLYHYFKKFCSVQNKNLINYKQIKEHINNLILKIDAQELQGKTQAITYRKRENISPLNIRLREKAQPLTSRKLNTDVNLSSDDEEGLKIEGQSQIPQSELKFMVLDNLQKAKHTIIKIDSKQIMNDNKYIKQSILDKNRGSSVTALPTMNKNTSIQNINNLDIETEV